MDKQKKPQPFPMPQRVRDLLREVLNREDKLPGRHGILAPLEAIAAKDVLTPQEVDYLVFNYNFSRKFLRTGKGEPYNRFHVDPRTVIDFNGEAYRSTFVELFYTFVTVPEDIKDFVAYARALMMEDNGWMDYKKIVDAIDSDTKQYEAAADEMAEKADAMDNEKISTYCMSKATLLGYLKGATELILLYQDMFDTLADMAAMPRSFDDEDFCEEEEYCEEKEAAPDIQLMARFGGSHELPS